MNIKLERKQAAQRRRRVIFNSDAGDADPGELKVADPEEFLKSRKTGLVGSSVDSIFYSTDQGFDYYTHYSEISEVSYAVNPVLKQLIDQGTDPLQITVEFGRNNGIEIFWSFRMNDAHDVDDGPLSRFKKEHPQYMFGTKENTPPLGAWTAVDYALPEVREHVFETFQDVCSRYDIDGIELDFFRRPVCFKRGAWGQILGPEELDTMSGLLRRVRTMADEIGTRRGRPLLIAVRVPDSVGFCLGLGIDLVRWLKEDLIDIMVVGGDFWLQPWQRMVELGHRFDVPVYPCLRGSPIGRWPVEALGHRKGTLHTRRTDKAYHAHALDAWNAGADGIYVFNLNYWCPPSHSLWTDLGDPDKLATLDKIYHVSVMGRPPDMQSYGPMGGRGERFGHLPTLSPNQPRELITGKAVATTIGVADDLSAAKDQGLRAELKLNVQVENLPGADGPSVKLNGEALTNVSLTWESEMSETWHEYAVDPQILKRGDNSLEITLTADADVERPCVCHDVHLRIDYVKQGNATT